MTRKEAIKNLMGAWYQRDMDVCCNEAEYDKSHEELIASLKALGVTQEEIDTR